MQGNTILKKQSESELLLAVPDIQIPGGRIDLCPGDFFHMFRTCVYSHSYRHCSACFLSFNAFKLFICYGTDQIRRFTHGVFETGIVLNDFPEQLALVIPVLSFHLYDKYETVSVILICHMIGIFKFFIYGTGRNRAL